MPQRRPAHRGTKPFPQRGNPAAPPRRTAARGTIYGTDACHVEQFSSCQRKDPPAQRTGSMRSRFPAPRLREPERLWRKTNMPPDAARTAREGKGPACAPQLRQGWLAPRAARTAGGKWQRTPLAHRCPRKTSPPGRTPRQPLRPLITPLRTNARSSPAKKIHAPQKQRPCPVRTGSFCRFLPSKPPHFARKKFPSPKAKF